MSESKHKVQHYPGYILKAYRWNYSQEVYDGLAFEYAGDNENSVTNNAQNYFPRKEQRESKEQYKERLRLLEPATYYATGVDSLVGTMFTSESDDHVTWEQDGKGLGDPTDPDSDAYQFINDADGNGLNWGFVGKQGAIKMTMKHLVYGLVDGIPEDADGNAIGGPTVKLIEPEAVVNKIYRGGRMIACRVKEERSTAQSLDDTQELQDCFVDYTLDGWKRWYFNKDGDKVPFPGADEGEYTYWRTKEKKEKILPIFEVELPLDRPVGYIWAKKCIAIANMESALEYGYRNASFAIFQPVASDTQWTEIKKDLKKGYNAFRSDPQASRDHAFIAPPSDHFDSYKDYLKEKIKNFFYNMFKDYGDVARERTATEIRLESQTGIEAFLTLLSGQTDELENQALWRVEQAHFPDSPENWGIARAKRSNDFAPIDLDALADSLAERFITGLETVPANVEVMKEVLTMVYNASGISIPNDEELKAIAEGFISERSQQQDLSTAMGV